VEKRFISLTSLSLGYMNSLVLHFPLISICPPFSLNFKKLAILGTGLLVFFLSFYVFQVQAIINKEYQIGKYQQTVKGLSKNNSSLEMEAAGLNSLENIEKKIENFNLVKVEEIKYILISKDYLVRETK
jgi:hypothetical protein